MVEELTATAPRTSRATGVTGADPPQSICQVDAGDSPRVCTGIGELDRVLGGGVVPGSLVLMGGDPGIGKSTLLLQACERLAQAVGRVLYVSGEESARQIRLRADRLQVAAPELFVLAETNLSAIEGHVRTLQPRFLVIDSIQTVFRPEIETAPGSVTQVRECATQLLQLAKTRGIATFLVGHVTKEGNLAGPRVLEHIVDTVLYVEGERHASFRLLRAVKNRFGSASELGVFEMREAGLVEVHNASELFLAQRAEGVAGSVVLPCLEGSRPLLVEVQALVGSTPFANPRRTAIGVDLNRVSLMLAVLEKRAGLCLGSQDAFVKIAGGVRVEEPAADLGLALSLASSFRNVASDTSAVVFGEVGLTGEVRTVARVEQRLREAERLGFKRAILPAGNVSGLSVRTRLELFGVRSLAEALNAALG